MIKLHVPWPSTEPNTNWANLKALPRGHDAVTFWNEWSKEGAQSHGYPPFPRHLRLEIERVHHYERERRRNGKRKAQS